MPRRRDVPKGLSREKRQIFTGRAVVNQWFERNQYVGLALDDDNGTEIPIVDWWDEEVSELVEDGFLDARGMAYRQYPIDPDSVTEYAASLGLIKSVNEPPDNSTSGTFALGPNYRGLGLYRGR